MSSLILPV